MTPEPFPPASQDPSVLEARQACTEYDQAVGGARLDPRKSDLAKAEVIDVLWRSLRQRLSDLRDAFYGPRLQRLNDLELMVPIGPGVPADASPADAAVLHQSFADALARAREMDASGLAALLADGQRFGNDTQVRAALTAASERGFGQIVQQWAGGDPERLSLVAQVGYISDLLAGANTDALLANQVFDRGSRAYPQPQESVDLPTLQRLAMSTGALSQLHPAWAGTPAPHPL